MPDPFFRPVEAPVLFRAPPGWRWRRRQPGYWNCWCALDGRCELRTAGRRFAVGPGTCFLLPPGGTIEADHDLRAPAVNLAIHGDFVDGAGCACMPANPPPLHVVLSDPLRLTRLAEDCLAAWNAGGEHGRAEYAALAQALVARIRRQATAGRPAGDPQLDQLLLEIHRRPDQAWSVASCAARLGLSRSQVTRRFQDAYGAPPADIIARCRDEYALQLVRESDLSLADIAAAAGYADASHLGRRLRARLGASPGSLRR